MYARAELAPGDVLWLPRYHWHLVRQVPDACGGATEHPPPFSPNLSLSAWVGGKGTEAFRAEADAAYGAALLRTAPHPTSLPLCTPHGPTAWRF